MAGAIFAYLSLLSGEAGFVAFNDFAPGVYTHTNATTFGPGQAGKLRDIISGATLPISVNVTSNGVAFGQVQGTPAYGSPASVVFDGFVDMSGDPFPGLELGAATNFVTYTFSGLDPERLYNFQGTAMRGHFSYKDRWSLFELGGAQGFTSHHSAGALTHSKVAGIEENQVAINTGDNTAGALAWWEDIQPAADGTFSVRCAKYTNSVPSGSSGGPVGYAIISFRLEENASYSGPTSPQARPVNQAPPRITGIETVFLVIMENKDWSQIVGASQCPYINKTLLPRSSYATAYYGVPGVHPSEPNYLWMMAGTNFNIRTDDLPSRNHQSSTNTLFHQLDQAGISWKAYCEDINGQYIPDGNTNQYVARHNPALFFDSLRTNVKYVTNHIRPYPELVSDLASDSAPRFCLIVPNLTNDMHSLAPGSSSTRVQGDTWLSKQMPAVFGSEAYKRGGALILTWDEGFDDADSNIGMVVVSPWAKGGGYHNKRFYTHGSTLRTLQDIFGVRPYLEEALVVESLQDLFAFPQLVSTTFANGVVDIVCESVPAGSTNNLQVSSDLKNWETVATKVVLTQRVEFQQPSTDPAHAFYRILVQP
jgi:hypothetical protein